MTEETWAKSALDNLFLDDETLEWSSYEANLVSTEHKDCNGKTLLDGDSVTLIKDLDVKGSNFAAKRGTTVKKISLVIDNPEQIEGRVNDQQIVLLTKFVKKV
jgi:protein PhnA